MSSSIVGGLLVVLFLFLVRYVLSTYKDEKGETIKDVELSWIVWVEVFGAGVLSGFITHLIW